MLRLDALRFLFGYDRWATRRVLDAARGVDAGTWSAPNAIGERGLGGILVHALGAHQRWRVGWLGRPERPRPELEPLPPLEELRGRWEAEWVALDEDLDGLTEGDLLGEVGGLPVWQTHLHLVNHGTQHRSEAAALLTAAGRSPGDLDLVFYALERRSGA